MERRVSTGPTAVRRRGSVDQVSDQPYIGDLKCPKCNKYFDSAPLIMPSCNHRVCRRCIGYASRQKSDRYFHCPVPKCNQLCATDPGNLRKDRELESKVRQHRLAAEQSDRRQTESRRGCQKSDCSADAAFEEPCPHCELRVCRDHFKDDCKLVNEECNTQIIESEQLLQDIRDRIELCKIHKVNLDNLIVDNRRTHEEMMACLEKRFKATQGELAKLKNSLNAAEKSMEEFYDSVRLQQESIKNSLEVEEDDYETLKKKFNLLTSAERLAGSIQLPRLPDDVRFNYTPADIDVIEQNINELRVLRDSLDVRVVDKLTIKCSGKELTPHHAVLWSHTEEFCLDSSSLIERRTRGSSEDSMALPSEVLIVSNMMKLYVLSTDGECLGQIKVQDSAPFVTKYLSISSSGRQLALLSADKVLLCDMDGTKQTEIKCNDLKEMSGLCSVSLTEKCMMIVDPGNTLHRKAGAVFLLEGPQFDPGQAKRIPLDRRRIFPTAATLARGSLLVLANKMSVEAGREVASNELLMYDRNCEFVADIACSDDFHSALYVNSDDSGRIFISISRSRSRDQSELGQPPQAEVMVLSPQGRLIGSIGSGDLVTCNGISIGAGSGGRTDRQKRLVVCDATSRLVHVYTLA